MGDSQSSVFDVIERKGEPVALGQTVTVQGSDAGRIFREAGWLKDPNALIKIDTEGAEYSILSSLGSAVADAACSFYISFHPSNLVSKDARPDLFIRARATLAWMDQLWDYIWWSGASGTLKRLDRSRYLELVLAGKTKRLPPVLFSRRDNLEGF